MTSVNSRSLNSNEICYMIISNRIIDSKNLKRHKFMNVSNQVKFLRVTINNKLSISQHKQNIAKHVNIATRITYTKNALSMI